jgi:glycosyltransferase involved in cell wall biosynthesis
MAVVKLLIATGIYPPEIGGPAYYAKFLCEALGRQNKQVKVVTYHIEKRLPTGIRHFWYAGRLLPSVLRCRAIIALDTFSVGLPAVIMGKIFRKKVIIRVGGDFLWEQYVGRTKTPVILRDFYSNDRELSLKEKMIFWLTKKTLTLADQVVFSTQWQVDIWLQPYNLNLQKVSIIENSYKRAIKNIDIKIDLTGPKVFLWAGRLLYLKNISKLKEAVADAKLIQPDIELKLLTGVSQSALIEEIKKSYAVVIPSLSEVSPNLALEACMYHKPLILTEENGLRDSLGDNVLYFNPLDVKELSQKIVFLSQEVNYQLYHSRLLNIKYDRSYDDIAGDFIKLIYENN